MSGLLWYLAESGAALAAFYGVYRLALKNDTHFRTGRLYLLASLVAAHLVPLFHITSPFRQVVVPAGAQEDFDATAVAAGGWDWQQPLLWLYAVGAAFVFLRLAWHLAHLVLIARRHPAVHRDGVRVVYVDEDCPPFSFFRTAFVHRPAAGDEQVLDQVVAHERTHIRQGHSLDILLIHVAAVVQWFNPFIWLYKRSLQELHEYLADREVLAQGFDPFTYKQILFEQHLGARSFEFAHHLHQSQIKRRLAMMTRRSGRWTAFTYLLALPALALLLVAFAEPQVTMAQGAKTPGTVTVAPTEHKKVQVADPATVEEKKQLEAEYKAKIEKLKADYDAASDPDVKKAIAEKMLKVKQYYKQAVTKVDLNDPVAVEKLITEISKKREVLKAKSQEVTDPATQEKIQQELAMLAKMQHELKAKLAQLQAGK
jgi:hypothetical protein